MGKNKNAVGPHLSSNSLPHSHDFQHPFKNTGEKGEIAC